MNIRVFQLLFAGALLISGSIVATEGDPIQSLARRGNAPFVEAQGDANTRVDQYLSQLDSGLDSEWRMSGLAGLWLELLRAQTEETQDQEAVIDAFKARRDEIVAALGASLSTDQTPKVLENALSLLVALPYQAPELAPATKMLLDHDSHRIRATAWLARAQHDSDSDALLTDILEAAFVSRRSDVADAVVYLYGDPVPRFYRDEMPIDSTVLDRYSSTLLRAFSNCDGLQPLEEKRACLRARSAITGEPYELPTKLNPSRQ